MKKQIKTLAFVFGLALCAFSFNASVVLADETVTDQNTTAVSTETVLTETTETNDGTENAIVPDPISVPEATENSDTEVETELPPVLDENGEVVLPGTLPDSPLYWLTTLIEKLQVIFTVDPVEKTKLLEEQALERIAEADALIENGNTEEAEVALQAYSEKVTEAQAFLATLTETDSETMQKLETALSESHAKNIQTLGGLLDKLPPQAAQKVALNVVKSMEKSIAKMEKKDQLRVAKELKKAAEGLEDTELSEEDQEALETLEETLEPQDGDLEETVAVTSGVMLRSMAVTADSLTTSTSKDTTANTSKESLQALSQKNEKYDGTELKAKVKAEEIPLQEQKEGLKAEPRQQEEKQQELKEQEQKPLEKQEQKEAKAPKERGNEGKSKSKE